ncbi:DUF547 domain-containing protein [Cellulophaga sp. L1A9]|uniref:DUF547 domain-containing protein n=1 Tax=Cellulophaga sp. L1A9 TaxID=2686362 RepID=UPI00131ABC98|nr:DUF547 domain-containing protein [Cellulophaga sp. L1A9]
MRKIIIISVVALLLGVVYLNKRFGLLSMAGLNGKGLPTKQVAGNLAVEHQISNNTLDHSQWTVLLKKYVDDNGQVNYKGFLQDRNRLEDYLDVLSKQVPTNNWSVQELLAYYINLYNAHTVALVLRNYPLKSIQDIDGPWTTDFVKIGDKELSLGALEHSILRKMNEPRIHFAINCASTSCPKLLNEAYTPENIEDQLEEAALGFIISGNNTITQDELILSRIFKWYKGDFSNGELISYLKPFTKIEIASKAAIDYKEYDWSLNEKN